MFLLQTANQLTNILHVTVCVRAAWTSNSQIRIILGLNY